MNLAVWTQQREKMLVKPVDKSIEMIQKNRGREGGLKAMECEFCKTIEQ